MLKRIDPSEITDETFQFVIEKLKNKLNVFDYVTEEGFIRNILVGNYIVYLSEHQIIFCEVTIHQTGLKTMHVGNVRLTDGGSTIEHIQEHLTYIEEEAKRIGIDRMTLGGRMGWTKCFPDYKIEDVKLFKEL